MAVDAFLKFDPELKGESTDDKHKGEIEVLAFSWGVSNNSSLGSGTGGGSGKSTPSPLQITKKIDKSSPTLFEKVASGTHFKKAILTIRKSGGDQVEYCVVTLETVYPSGYQISDSSGGDLPMESLSLNYAKITTEYKEQKGDGSLGGAVKGGYDYGVNKKI